MQSGWSEISQEWFAATAMDLEVEMHSASSANAQASARGAADSRSVHGAPERITLSSGYGTYDYGDIASTGADRLQRRPAASAEVETAAHDATMGKDGTFLMMTRCNVCICIDLCCHSESDLLSLPGMNLSAAKRTWKASDALLIGSYPHDKLFSRVAAVVHHGGAGTAIMFSSFPVRNPY